MTVVFAVYLWMDQTYVTVKEAQATEQKIVSALDRQIEHQSRVFEKQIRLMDQRQLDQLRTSKALLDSAIRKDPNDRLLRHEKEVTDCQINELNRRLSQ
jgi:hypothetical protein